MKISPEVLRARIVNSMLWAAWGDAIGFPAELVGEKQFRRRLDGAGPADTVTWRKVVGGRFGVEVELPRGAYSDDTQLRLATARAIMSNGKFDVEIFSKIELTVWLSYALGAGRGSKAAATGLISPNVAWFSNFYENKYGRYISGGGNGAAMRIQPHVWAARDLNNPASYLVDVLRNAVCTHGHLHGIVGALIHAEHLSEAILQGEIPAVAGWARTGDRVISMVASLVREDHQLRDLWLPTWEIQANTSLTDALDAIATEWSELVRRALATEKSENNPVERYRSYVQLIGGFDPATRGSGLISAVLSIAGSSWLEQMGGEGAITEIATLIGSDTDTIGSMAGALIGACSSVEPKSPVQDEEYLRQVAERLFHISCGKRVDDFIYPDLLYWQPPRTALDSVSRKGEMTMLAGLGRMVPAEEEWTLPRGGGTYRWFQLWFGQKVLCKFRASVQAKEERTIYMSPTMSALAGKEPDSKDLFSSAQSKQAADLPTLDHMTDQIIRGGFDPTEIGAAILSLGRKSGGIELPIALTSIIVKALLARAKKGT